MKNKILVGDLYRVHQNDVALIALVITRPYRKKSCNLRGKIRKRLVDVVPMTIEPEGENRYALVIKSIELFLLPDFRSHSYNRYVDTSNDERIVFEIKDSPVEATLWLNLVYALSLDSLDIKLGSLNSSIVACCLSQLKNQPRSLPDTLRAGKRPTSIFSKDNMLEVELADQFASVADSEKGFLSFITEIDYGFDFKK